MSRELNFKINYSVVGADISRLSFRITEGGEPSVIKGLSGGLSKKNVEFQITGNKITAEGSDGPIIKSGTRQLNRRLSFRSFRRRSYVC